LRPGNPEHFASSIRSVARTVGIEPALIYAVVQAESAFDPNAVSPKGAVGLMQLMPATARRYGVENRRDPMQNLHGGARYLRDLLIEFRDLRLALAAYNAGENAVRKYGNSVPPYAETQQYVKRVQRFYQRFRTSG
jgi:soluble lytic murein transglycosylase-like protein